MSFTDDDDAEPTGFSLHDSDPERDLFDLEIGEEAEGKVTLQYGLELDEDDLIDDDDDIRSEVDDDDDDEDDEDDDEDDDDEDDDEDELLLDHDDGLDFEEEEY